MKVVDPQTATLTNIEVLSYLTANQPRKSPEGPPGFRNYKPNPDLRPHCKVVDEIHNYVDRISPHLLNYPRYTHDSQNPSTKNVEQASADQQQQEPYVQPKELTPLDNALQKLIRELSPYNLTKGEVMMLINLGIGIKGDDNNDNENNTNNAMDVDADGAVNGGGEEGEEEEAVDDDYGNKVLMDAIVEDSNDRLTDDDVSNILKIMDRVLRRRE